MMHYRKQYEILTDTKLLKNEVVHHLNGNRFMCDIENLVAIDSFTHSNYHKYLLSIYNNQEIHLISQQNIEDYESVKIELENAIIKRNKLLKKALKVDEQNVKK